jgi:hypothetical protein
MSDILIGVIVFGLVFGAAIFGMFLGRNLRVLEQKVNASDVTLPLRSPWPPCLNLLKIGNRQSAIANS